MLNSITGQGVAAETQVLENF